jgi:hypothetical protein
MKSKVRILAHPLLHFSHNNTYMNQKQKDTIREGFIKDFCRVEPYRDTELLYFKGILEKNFNLIPTPKTIMLWFDELLDQAYQQGAKDKVEEVRELIEERIENGYTITRRRIAIPYTDKIVEVVLQDIIESLKDNT